jgi:hypothetical protein
MIAASLKDGSEGRCPRADMPIRSRAALGPRSAGKKTGLHVIAGGECRKRERRKAGVPLPDPPPQAAEGGVVGARPRSR